MDARARDLLNVGNRLFSKRQNVDTLWQVIAENFYPERADFTSARSDGDEFMAGLMASYPVLARRELGNVFASMLRPRSARWLKLESQDEQINEDRDARAWFEWASGVQWRAMYDAEANFVNATSEADHDFAAFGNAVIEVVPDRNKAVLLYRCWHLRDCAWSVNAAGKVDGLHRKWTPTARELVRLFGKTGTLHGDIVKCIDKEPFKEIKCRHVMVPTEDYDLGEAGKRKMPFTSLIIDDEHETIIEKTPSAWFSYVVPRWKTVSGSPYARSPATEIVLPDARTLQTLTQILLEAGEKAVDPPMIAAAEALRSDVNLMAGGVTTVDIEYDERTGDALRQVQDVGSGLPLGMDMAEQVRAVIDQGFFLNRINLPDLNTKTMTAFEVRRRIEEHVRTAAPIFEPIEAEYNAPLCNLTFEILKANGAFGPVDTMPEMLRGTEVQFTFVSPLRELADEIKGQSFLEGLPVIEAAARIDPSVLEIVDVEQAARDSLTGFRWPAKWMRPAEAIAAKRREIQQQQKMAQGTEAIQAGAQIADTAGSAMDKMNKAGMLQQLLGDAA